MEIKDIEKLAKLSRIELTDKEKGTYLKDIGSILAYVDQIKGAVAEIGEERKVADLRNIMRVDEVVMGEESKSSAVIAEFPQKQGDYLKVKKILEN